VLLLERIGLDALFVVAPCRRRMPTL